MYIFILSALLILISFPALAQQAPMAVQMKNKQGNDVGTIRVTETPQGLFLRLSLKNIPAGWHGFHIHQNGLCEGPDFTSAGEHFTLSGKHHGILGQGPAHEGDLPNVYASQNGQIQTDIFVPGLSLSQDRGTSLPVSGAAIILHEKEDDYKTDPSGHSGGRIACGVLKSPF